MNRFVFLLFLLFFAVYTLDAQSLADETLQHAKLYTSIEEALLEPENVYRLKLKKCKKCDSLPQALFQLKNLRELNVSRLKIKQLNESIALLSQLEYLNISQNKLTKLPASIGNLLELKVLIINRNKIEELPESIANLKQLTQIDAWDNPIYVLPASISKLAETLQVIDLRQVPLKESELQEMEYLLPKTTIKYTSICECENAR